MNLLSEKLFEDNTSDVITHFNLTAINATYCDMKYELWKSITVINNSQNIHKLKKKGKPSSSYLLWLIQSALLYSVKTVE